MKAIDLITTANPKSATVIVTPKHSGETRHPLWKEGDPKENSMAFYMKYDCYNYSELENKNNQ